MKKDDLPDLAALKDDLSIAMADYEEAGRQESQARSRATDSLNKLNTAQKELDAAMDKIRERADMQTDWGQQRRDNLRKAS